MNGVEGPLSQHRLFFAYVEHPRSARAVEAIGVLRLTHSFASEAVGSLRMTELRELMAPRIYTWLRFTGRVGAGVPPVRFSASAKV